MKEKILMTRSILLDDFYIIYLDSTSQLIDSDWAAIKADYNKRKGIKLVDTDKEDFILVFSTNSGFIWIEKFSIYNAARPLLAAELDDLPTYSHQEFFDKYTLANDDTYYINLFDYFAQNVTRGHLKVDS